MKNDLSRSNLANFSQIALLFIGWVLAIGIMPAPAISAPFKPDIKQLIENAKTAQDHRSIAEYYASQAEQAKTTAAEHKEMAKRYRSWHRINKSMVSYRYPQHCERLANAYYKAATEYAALAKEHEAMALDLEKNAK